MWVDGPLTTAARLGAICYLDEVVEARQDTVVVIHPLTDDRRILPIEKTGELLEAAPGFQLVISYNPGYQHAIKDLKPSTRQRFVTLDFDFPSAGNEAEIVAHESGVKRATAQALVELARRVRRLQGTGTRRRTGHAAARLGRRSSSPSGIPARAGVSVRARRAAHRRSGSARGDRRPRRGDALMRRRRWYSMAAPDAAQGALSSE